MSKLTETAAMIISRGHSCQEPQSEPCAAFNALWASAQKWEDTPRFDGCRAEINVRSTQRQVNCMPWVNIKVIENVFSDGEKQRIIEEVTDALVSVARREPAGQDGGDRRGGEERAVGDRRSGGFGRTCQRAAGELMLIRYRAAPAASFFSEGTQRPP